MTIKTAPHFIVQTAWNALVQTALTQQFLSFSLPSTPSHHPSSDFYFTVCHSYIRPSYCQYITCTKGIFKNKIVVSSLHLPTYLYVTFFLKERNSVFRSINIEFFCFTTVCFFKSFFTQPISECLVHPGCLRDKCIFFFLMQHGSFQHLQRKMSTLPDRKNELKMSL